MSHSPTMDPITITAPPIDLSLYPMQELASPPDCGGLHDYWQGSGAFENVLFCRRCGDARRIVIGGEG